MNPDKMHNVCLNIFRNDRTNFGLNGGSIGSSSSGLGSSGGVVSNESSDQTMTSTSASEVGMKVKRENILSELLVTESRYSADLEQVGTMILPMT